jgi:hypothetical protein
MSFQLKKHPMKAHAQAHYTTPLPRYFAVELWSGDLIYFEEVEINLIN